MLRFFLLNIRRSNVEEFLRFSLKLRSLSFTASEFLHYSCPFVAVCSFFSFFLIFLSVWVGNMALTQKIVKTHKIIWNRSLSWVELFFWPATWRRCRKCFKISSVLGNFLCECLLDNHLIITFSLSCYNKHWQLVSEMKWLAHTLVLVHLPSLCLWISYWEWLYLELWVDGDGYFLLLIDNQIQYIYEYYIYH